MKGLWLGQVMAKSEILALSLAESRLLGWDILLGTLGILFRANDVQALYSLGPKSRSWDSPKTGAGRAR